MNIFHKTPTKTVKMLATDRVPIFHQITLIEEVKNNFTEHILSYDSIDYVYVVDEANNLINILSLKDVYRAHPDTQLGDIKRHKLIFLSPGASQEKAVYLALRHKLKTIPVVEKGRLIGVIPNNQLVHIAYRELRGDLLKLVGVHHGHNEYDDVTEIPLSVVVKHRVPWLIIGLFGGILAARIIGAFESTLEKNIVLATFIPLVVYIADAAGTQLEAFTIRDFVTFRKVNILMYLYKQVRALAVIAISLGVVIAVIGLVLYHDPALAAVLGLSITLATFSSVCTGIIIPLIFRSFKMDPANASGPIGTIIQDILSVFVFFMIASWLL